MQVASWQNSGSLGYQSVLSRPEGFYKGKSSVGQVQLLGSDCPFLSANHYENQNIKIKKNRSTLSFCRKSSLMCSWHLCSDK